MSDVAALAGVSHQTVSRVLNDHPSVRPETRERVNEAIATLGYRRNSAARALVTRRSGTLGVVTPATALYGPTSTLVGLEEAARVVGWYVSVATIRQFDGDSMHTALEHFLGQGVDGIAIIAPTTEVAQAIAAIASPVPVVLISSASDVPPVAHLHAVGVDQRHGARLATQHLLDQGFAEVVHVAGPQDWFDAQDRLAGWREVVRPRCTRAHRGGLGRGRRLRARAADGPRGAAVGDLRGQRPAGARPAARVLGEGCAGAVATSRSWASTTRSAPRTTRRR